MFSLPVISLLLISIFCVRACREEKLVSKIMSSKHEQGYLAALIALGCTFSWFIFSLDIMALVSLKDENLTPEDIYYTEENKDNEDLFIMLIISTVIEFLVIVIFDLCLLFFWPIFKRFTRYKENRYDLEILALALIPPIWCLSSHFGFIVVAFTSFVRHSTSLILFYAIAIAIMFSTMNQMYTFARDICLSGWRKKVRHRGGSESEEVRHRGGSKSEEVRHRGGSESEEILVEVPSYGACENIQNRSGSQDQTGNGGNPKKIEISIPAILILRGMGVIFVGIFAYLMLGLWLLPVIEVVEDAPRNLYDSLYLMGLILTSVMWYLVYTLKKSPMETNNINSNNKPLLHTCDTDDSKKKEPTTCDAEDSKKKEPTTCDTDDSKKKTPTTSVKPLNSRQV